MSRKRSTDPTAMAKAVAAELIKAGYIEGAKAIGAVVRSPGTQFAAALGPNVPLRPEPLDPDVDGVNLPRRTQYTPGWNINIGGNRLVPFTTLRQAADGIDLLVKFREVRKRQLTRLPWSFEPSRKAVVRETFASKSKAHAVSALRRKHEAEAERLAAFWTSPDVGWSWHDWLSAALEDHFVLDALTIYPRLSLAGKLLGLEIIDGTTMRPLLDDRGGTPAPPWPAYQQVLWGFPRGDYTMSEDDAKKGAPDFAATDLIYRPRFRRSWTPYGYSLVEQSLVAANLYASRQQWLTAEYSQGTTPRTWLLPDDTVTFNPEQRHLIEDSLNNDLSGSTAERHRLKISPPGFKVQEMLMVEARYKADYDMHIINLLGAIWCVPLTEAGFSPIHGGLGANGMADTFQDLILRGAVQPDALWLSGIIDEISRKYLGMSDDLTFTFGDLEIEDDSLIAKVNDTYLRDGATTINRIQAKMGEPPFDIPEADEPFIATARGLVFLRGEMDRQALVGEGEALLDPSQGVTVPIKPTGPQIATPPEDPTVGDVPAPPPAPVAAKAALAAFERFAPKRKVWRDFDFAGAVPDEIAEALNALGRAKEFDAIKAVVSSPHSYGPERGLEGLGDRPGDSGVGA